MKAQVLPNNRIKELPEVKKPDMSERELFESFSQQGLANGASKAHSIWWLYNNSLQACKEYEIVGTHDWKVGDVVEENVHYRKEIDAHPDWQPTYNNPDDPPTVIFVVPIKQEAKRVFTLDDMLDAWKDGNLRGWQHDKIDHFKKEFFKTKYNIEL